MQFVCNFGVLVWLTDKRGIDSRLASAQTALMLQEETIRRNERERKVMADKINSLERSLAAADTEKRQQEVHFCLPPSDRNTMQKQHSAKHNPVLRWPLWIYIKVMRVFLSKNHQMITDFFLKNHTMNYTNMVPSHYEKIYGQINCSQFFQIKLQKSYN